MSAFLKQSLAGLRVLLVMTVILGLGYPLAVYGVGRLMPARADGSLIVVDGERVGSSLIGQNFDGDEWFRSRPSVAGDGYDPLASGASNLGPENPDLLATVEARRAEVAEREGVDPEQVPVDAVTASGSGLDPHISPEYADLQVARVARLRGLDVAVVNELVTQATTAPELGFLGAPRVNVVELNAALLAMEQ
jgi:K+-transporting ATPase ATPase C chain